MSDDKSGFGTHLVPLSPDTGKARPSPAQSRGQTALGDPFRPTFARHGFLVFIVLGVATLLVLATASPILTAVPGRDSGVFLYAAWRILHGGVPYLVLWDHKPPLIFYIDALGLVIGGGTLWGVWILQFVAVGLSATIGYRLTRQLFGFAPAVTSTLLTLLALPFILDGGNLTEEFALPIQFGAFLLFSEGERRGRYGWRAWALGFLGAAAFLLKQDLVGVWIALIVYATMTRGASFRSALSILGPLFAAATVLMAVVAAYFAANGALGALWSDAFLYNVAYSSAGILPRLHAGWSGVSLTSRDGLGIFALVGLIAAVAYVRYSRGQTASYKPLIAVCAVDILIEVALAAVSGRSYGHYFMAWLPAECILAAFALFLVFGNRVYDSKELAAPRSRLGRSGPLLFACAACFIFILPTAKIGADIRDRIQSDVAEREVVDFITASTPQDGYVLFWGAETTYNFATHRNAPTKFAYLYPLLTPHYATNHLAGRFFDDLAKYPPALIVDTSATNRAIPPIKKSRFASWTPPPEYASIPSNLLRTIDWIRTSYVASGETPGKPWTVYKPMNP